MVEMIGEMQLAIWSRALASSANRSTSVRARYNNSPVARSISINCVSLRVLSDETMYYTNTIPINQSINRSSHKYNEQTHTKPPSCVSTTKWEVSRRAIRVLMRAIVCRRAERVVNGEARSSSSTLGPDRGNNVSESERERE
jgi:hypothetical protein